MYLNVPSDPIQELAFRGNNHVYAEYYIHTEGSTSKTFETYLIDLFGAGAKVGERTMQARVDKTTGFLVDPTLYSEDPDNLEDIDSIKERSPEFRFQRYRRGSSRRKTYKVQKQRRRKTFRKK